MWDEYPFPAATAAAGFDIYPQSHAWLSTFGCRTRSISACRIKVTEPYAKLVDSDGTAVRRGCAPASHLSDPAAICVLDRIRGASAKREWRTRPGSLRDHPGVRRGSRVRAHAGRATLRLGPQGRHPASSYRCRAV